MEILRIRTAGPAGYRAMFDRFRSNPAKKLEAKYRRLLEEARDLQRRGDIKAFATKTAEAEALAAQIDEQRSKSDG